MKCVHLLAALAVAMLSVPSAWAQFGLYGSPELLRLPPVHQTSSEQFGQFGQRAMPLPAAPARSIASDRMPGVQTTRTTLVPNDPGYPEEVVRPTIETPAAPTRAIPLLGSTFLGMAPADSAKEQPQRGAAKQKLHPEPALAPESCDGVVSRMLQESGCFEPNPWTEPGPAAGYSPVECEPAGVSYSSPWFGGLSGLIMGRDAPNRVWTTYESTNQANQLMHTNDIGLNWQGGAEVTIGRRFNCDRWSVGVTYWSLNSFSGFASQTAAGEVSTPLDFTSVIYDNAALNVPGVREPYELFDNAQEHRLWRTNEIHNIELNFIRNHVDVYLGDCPEGNPLAVDWMFGARFFRFEEDLRFGSLDSGPYTWAGDLDSQGFLRNRSTNNLVGFQIGCDAEYSVWQNIRLFARPKIGIYNNHINNSFMAYRGDGEVFAPDPTSGVTGSYPVNSHEDSISFLTEVNLGLDWQFLPNWTLTAGYRVVMATGIALADNQIPFYIVDIPELANINNNGQLVLHGVFSGFEFNY